MRKVSKSKKETAEIAKIFLKALEDKKKHKAALVVGLSGNLGAGKTAFTKAAAEHLGVRETVNSPTFVLIKRYPIRKSKIHKHLYHIDAYRLKNERELIALGWKDIVKDPENLVLIEWPENVKHAMPRHAKYVYIAHKEKGHRELKLK